MGLVFRVDGQLEVEAIVDVDVREHPRLLELDDLLALDVELEALALQYVGKQAHGIGEHVDVDVGAFADVAGHHAADEARAEGPQDAHEAQRFQAHFAQMLGTFLPSWMRAKTWIWSRISALEGRFSGLTPRRQRRLAALRLAV